MRQIKRIIFITLVCVIFLSGCVEEEGVTPIETPTPTATPEETVSTPTLTPMPTPEPAWEPEVTLKPGYKWYQDNEFGYGFAYPEDWNSRNITGGDVEKGVAYYNLGSDDLPEATFAVMIYSRPEALKPINNDVGYAWFLGYVFEREEWLKKAKEAKEIGILYSYGNITLNNREGFELIYNPAGTLNMKMRMIVFSKDNIDYALNANAMTAKGDFYNKYENTFDAMMKSFIIKE